MKVIDDQVAVGNRPWNHLHERTEHGGWTEGTVVTQHGIVEVYAQGDEDHFHCSKLSIVKGGVRFDRQINGKRYTQRGLVTLAKKFANEVFDG